MAEVAIISTIAFGVLGTSIALGFVVGVLLGAVLGLEIGRRAGIPLAIISFVALLLWFIFPFPASAVVYAFAALIGMSVGLIIGGIAKEVYETQALIKQLLAQLEKRQEK